MTVLWMPRGESPSVSEVRINIVERPPEQLRLSLVNVDKPFYAYACVGTGERTTVAASAYGETYGAAMAALEIVVLTPPKKAKHSRPGGINHRAQAKEPAAAFTSTCIACGGKVYRVYGAAARLGNFRHTRREKPVTAEV